MWNVLKILFVVLLCLILLAFILPLLWLVIKEAGGLFGGLFTGTGNDFWYIVFTVVCVIFIIWSIASWNS